MLASGSRAQDITIAGVGCMVCDTANASGTLLYFHGGGYRLGAPAGWAGFASGLAAASKKRIIVPDYRLAPEHPFPAALHDAMTVYRALLGDGGAPFSGGDSAGGGLAAALALACRDLILTPPAGVVLLSPWLDLTCTDHNRAGDPNEMYFPRTAAIDAAALYLQGADPKAPLASPLFGDMADYPPTLLLVSSAEYLLDDALAFQGTLSKAGRRVEAEIALGQPHVWPILAPDSAEGKRAIARIASFLT